MDNIISIFKSTRVIWTIFLEGLKWAIYPHCLAMPILTFFDIPSLMHLKGNQQVAFWSYGWKIFKLN